MVRDRLAGRTGGRIDGEPAKLVSRVYEDAALQAGGVVPFRLDVHGQPRIV
jgi:hypothetical protein